MNEKRKERGRLFFSVAFNSDSSSLIADLSDEENNKLQHNLETGLKFSKLIC